MSHPPPPIPLRNAPSPPSSPASSSDSETTLTPSLSDSQATITPSLNLPLQGSQIFNSTEPPNHVVGYFCYVPYDPSVLTSGMVKPSVFQVFLPVHLGYIGLCTAIKAHLENMGLPPDSFTAAFDFVRCARGETWAASRVPSARRGDAGTGFLSRNTTEYGVASGIGSRIASWDMNGPERAGIIAGGNGIVGIQRRVGHETLSRLQQGDWNLFWAGALRAAKGPRAVVWRELRLTL